MACNLLQLHGAILCFLKNQTKCENIIQTFYQIAYDAPNLTKCKITNMMIMHIAWDWAPDKLYISMLICIEMHSTNNIYKDYLYILISYRYTIG